MTSQQLAWLGEQVAGVSIRTEGSQFVAYFTNEYGTWESDPATTESGARSNFSDMWTEIIDDAGTSDAETFAAGYVNEYGVDEEDLLSEWCCYVTFDKGQAKSVKKAASTLARAALKWLIKFLIDASRNLQGPIVIKTQEPE